MENMHPMSSVKHFTSAENKNHFPDVYYHTTLYYNKQIKASIISD